LKAEPAKIADWLMNLAGESLDVFPLQCVRARHQKAECGLCAENCPTGAIHWEDARPIDVKRCTGCGVCAAVCPTGALEATRPTNEELLVQIEDLARTTSTIAFACPRVPENDGTGLIRVPCLGRLDPSVLVGAAAMGVERIELVDSQCSSCPYAAGRSAAGQARDEANAILQACGKPAGVVFVAESTPQGLLSHHHMMAADTADPSDRKDPARAEARIKKGELPVRVPAKRRLLSASLARLEEPVGSPELATQLWSDITIAENCTGCQMCAFFCPTGALVKTSENAAAGLAFTTATCVNCRLCAEICYTDSIRLDPSVKISRLIDPTSEVVWSNTQKSSYEEKMKRLRMFK
jgi:Pyruvate/2-oxoacid:ferredoxin oxidoreductase delta subunit